MAIFALEAVSILLYLMLIDHSQFRKWLPLLFTSLFLRFLCQYILIDWLQVWKVEGPAWLQLWSPITADITIWAFLSMLFVQYLPRRSKRLWYGFVFVSGCVGYEQVLARLGVLSFSSSWHISYSFLLLTLYFKLIYEVWVWLAPQQNKGGELI